MTTSRWQQISVALLAALRAQPGWCAPAAWVTGLVPVYDGVEVLLTDSAHVPGYVVIRWAGTEEDPRDTGLARRQIATLGHRARDEIGTIRCRAVAQNGDADLEGAATACYAAAFGLLDTVGALVLADPTLGLATPRLVVQVGDHDVRQYAGDGLTTEIDFEITYTTRI